MGKAEEYLSHYEVFVVDIKTGERTDFELTINPWDRFIQEYAGSKLDAAMIRLKRRNDLKEKCNG